VTGALTTCTALSACSAVCQAEVVVSLMSQLPAVEVEDLPGLVKYLIGAAVSSNAEQVGHLGVLQANLWVMLSAGCRAVLNACCHTAMLILTQLFCFPRWWLLCAPTCTSSTQQTPAWQVSRAGLPQQYMTLCQRCCCLP
jgi:hypothetical protein